MAPDVGDAEVATAGTIAFRLMTRDDFPQFCAWLREPHIAEWWRKVSPTLDALEAKYGPNIDGATATANFIALFEARPIGMMQSYRVSDYPEYAHAIGIDDGVGVDWFIGDPNLVGKGVGPRMMERFIADVLRPTYVDVTWLVVSPSVHNARSIRALEKLGFIARGAVDVPGEADPELVMVRSLK